MKQEHINEIIAIILLAFGMLLLASLVSYTPTDLGWFTSNPNFPSKNFIRITGAYVAGTLLFAFGYSAYFIVLFLFFLSWNKFASQELKLTKLKFIFSFILFCIISALFAVTGSAESAAQFQRAGIIGYMVGAFLLRNCGLVGSYIILIMLGLGSFIIAGESLVSPFFIRAGELFKKGLEKLMERKKEHREKPAFKPQINYGQNLNVKKLEKENTKEENGKKKEEKLPEEKPRPEKIIPPKIKIAEVKKEKVEESEEEPEEEANLNYKMPPLNLLEDPPVIATSKLQNDLMQGAKLLEQTLAEFGVEARVVDIERGPAITRYELEPAPGVKVQKFTALDNDIALAMRAATVRIVAPIPGKDRVGIEVPNASSATVYLKDVLSSSEFRASKSKLTLSLGKDTAGAPMIANLAEMPHLLIAGTTGSGKTVCVNGIIMSMLFNATPDELKFLMIDPKMVELAQYNDIPHLICPTITDSQKASIALNWVVSEMESRYKRLSKEGVRNIQGYIEAGHKMYYLVVIIDELADLMQVSAKTVESSITRLAQLSRAVGIHLILATQRPSVNVITGVIKANFPARISFKVASKVDSRTVLDMNGAETLLGKGDMLFMKPGDAKPTRGQCSFIKDEEIARVISFIKEQQAPNYNENVLKPQRAGAAGTEDTYDEFYDEAVKLVIETNQASVSILQRRLRLGYTRAARLIDMMEQNGIVGPYVGSKPREILVDREQWLIENMNETEADSATTKDQEKKEL